MATAIDCASFLTVPPLVWLETPYYVQDGIKIYDLEIAYANPCSFSRDVDFHRIGPLPAPPMQPVFVPVNIPNMPQLPVQQSQPVPPPPPHRAAKSTEHYQPVTEETAPEERRKSEQHKSGKDNTINRLPEFPIEQPMTVIMSHAKREIVASTSNRAYCETLFNKWNQALADIDDRESITNVKRDKIPVSASNSGRYTEFKPVNTLGEPNPYVDKISFNQGEFRNDWIGMTDMDEVILSSHPNASQIMTGGGINTSLFQKMKFFLQDPLYSKHLTRNEKALFTKIMTTPRNYHIYDADIDEAYETLEKFKFKEIQNKWSEENKALVFKTELEDFNKGIRHLHRAKRGLAKDLAVAALTGAASTIGVNIVTNLVQSVYNYFDPTSETNRLHRLELDAVNFQNRLATLTNVTHELIDRDDYLKLELASSISKMEDSMRMGLEANLINNLITTKILLSTNNLQRLIKLYLVKKQLDSVALSNIFNIDEFRNIDERDTHVYEIRHNRHADRELAGLVHMKFAVRVRSKHTKVWQAYGFKHWDNLTETPMYVRYNGERFFIYNEKMDCIKHIDKPEVGDMLAITDSCETPKGRDPSLDDWIADKHGSNIYDTVNEAQVKETDTMAFVYCFPGNITFNNETHRCPSRPMPIELDRYFKVAGYEHKPILLKGNITHSWQIPKAQDAHFTSDMDVNKEYHHIEGSSRLHQMLKEKDEKLHSYPVSPGTALFMSLYSIVITGTIVLALCYCCTSGLFRKMYAHILEHIQETMESAQNNEEVEMQPTRHPPPRLTRQHSSTRRPSKPVAITRLVEEYPQIEEPRDRIRYEYTVEEANSQAAEPIYNLPEIPRELKTRQQH